MSSEHPERSAQSQRLDRRSFMARASLASLALTVGPARAAALSADGAPQHAARAKRVVHICLCGGLSQVDSFDYKPELIRHHGKSLGAAERPDVFFGKVGLLRRPDWEFKQRGQSGLWVSELFPHIAQVADELTVIRSMVAESSNHTPATFQENTGFARNGFPTLGAWLSYGLGSETRDLPGHVVIPDVRGFPAGGTINWSAGFLPAEHQGVVLRASGAPVANLEPARAIADGADSAARRLRALLDERHRAARAGEPVLAAREEAHALAQRMRRAVPEVADLSSESEETRALYGMNEKLSVDFGRACLLTRRLLERGVRFVQLFSGGSFGNPRINWDGHEDNVRNHGREAPRIDQPVAALLRDLRRSGMLDDTLVMFTSEFGRTPFTQAGADQVGTGRDHNQRGFSVWLAGAGLRPGMAYGETDELGYSAVSDVVTWPDFHATVLHLLGIDHERLTYYHDGIQRRLTNVHGAVIERLFV